MLARHEYASKTHEDAFEDTGAQVRSSPDDQVQQHEEQQRSAVTAAKNKAQKQSPEERRESIRSEYLQSRESHPKHAAFMSKMYPNELADLIEATP